MYEWEIDSDLYAADWGLWFAGRRRLHRRSQGISSLLFFLSLSLSLFFLSFSLSLFFLFSLSLFILSLSLSLYSFSLSSFTCLLFHYASGILTVHPPFPLRTPACVPSFSTWRSLLIAPRVIFICAILWLFFFPPQQHF